MKTNQEQLPPHLTCRQLLNTWSLVDPLFFVGWLARVGYTGHAQEIKQFIDKGSDDNYTPLLIAWRTGEYCLVKYGHVCPGVPVINISDEVVLLAYRTARDTTLTGPPVIAARFAREGVAND